MIGVGGSKGRGRGATSMSVDGATATPTAVQGRVAADEARRNDPYRFLSTRLVRELISCDAAAEAAGEDPRAIASRLIEAVGSGLSQPGVALLGAATLGTLASRGFEAEELALLESSPGGGPALAQRALDERRVLLLGRGSREPLLPALREIRPDWTGLVLVPLCDREQCAGVLVLGGTDVALPAAFLRSLTPAFRLLTLLLHPGRGADAPDQVAGGDVERLSVEIEELRARLAEAREQLRTLENEDSSSQAAQRAEAEALRARVAELEATAAAGGAEQGRIEELESDLEERRRNEGEAVEKLEQLASENESLRDRLQAAEAAVRDAEARAAEHASAEEALRLAAATSDALAANGAAAEEQAQTLPLMDGDDLELGEIAEAAAAAIGDDAVGVDGASAPVDDGDLTVVASDDGDEGPVDAEPAVEGSAPAEASVGLWHVDHDPEARAWAGELAARCGARLWDGEGEPPAARKSMLLMNLFDESVERALSLVDREVESLVYAADAETGEGFELGKVGWVRRPLDPKSALARIQTCVPRRLGGIVIVSAQLRELAGLRQALAEVDAAGSVACDARQASDLLDIVRRPDAVLIDLTLEGGQGFALARQLRTTPETCDVPILFLLPETLQAQTLRADAERGGVLGPYGADDARRMLNGALAPFS